MIVIFNILYAHRYKPKQFVKKNEPLILSIISYRVTRNRQTKGYNLDHINRATDSTTCQGGISARISLFIQWNYSQIMMLIV